MKRRTFLKAVGILPFFTHVISTQTSASTSSNGVIIVEWSRENWEKVKNYRTSINGTTIGEKVIRAGNGFMLLDDKVIAEFKIGPSPFENSSALPGISSRMSYTADKITIRKNGNEKIIKDRRK